MAKAAHHIVSAERDLQKQTGGRLGGEEIEFHRLHRELEDAPRRIGIFLQQLLVPLTLGCLPRSLLRLLALRLLLLELLLLRLGRGLLLLLLLLHVFALLCLLRILLIVLREGVEAVEQTLLLLLRIARRSSRIARCCDSRITGGGGGVVVTATAQTHRLHPVSRHRAQLQRGRPPRQSLRCSHRGAQ
jgi:hypothetical protein